MSIGAEERKRFGTYLIELRTAKGLSRAEVSRRASVGYSWLTGLEKGYAPLPYLETLERLAAVLDVPTDTLSRSVGFVCIWPCKYCSYLKATT